MVPLPAELQPLEQCIGRILRQDVHAERDNPPFDRVCMDGIAVSSAAVAGGVRSFRIEATQAAGAPALRLSGPACAIEVMTGAMTPLDADCVIPLEEYALADGLAMLHGETGAGPWRNVQRRGSESRPGVPMLTAGMRLGAPEIAVVASAGCAGVLVTREPRIMVISTGDELIEPGLPIAGHQVRRSNAYAVVAALRERGLGRVGHDHVPDDAQQLHRTLSRHLAAHDVLVLSGGISKGRFDLVPRVLEQLQVQEVFREVAQRPGMPLWFGVGPGGQAVFGLPGNPVATLICLVRYVAPAIAAATGGPRPLPEPVALASPIERGRPITSFVPVSVRYDASGRHLALPRIPNGSGDFLALAGTAGFVELPPQTGAYPEGFEADLYRW